VCLQDLEKASFVQLTDNAAERPGPTDQLVKDDPPAWQVRWQMERDFVRLGQRQRTPASFDRQNSKSIAGHVPYDTVFAAEGDDRP
jgi:hypothetical protein